MKVYIIGPMRACVGLNHKNFDKAAKWLRSMDNVVFSPAEIDREKGITDQEAVSESVLQSLLLNDFKLLMSADAVCVLPGWTQSQYAPFELALAESFDKIVLTVPNPGDYCPEYLDRGYGLSSYNYSHMVNGVCSDPYGEKISRGYQ